MHLSILHFVTLVLELCKPPFLLFQPVPWWVLRVEYSEWRITEAGAGRRDFVLLPSQQLIPVSEFFPHSQRQPHHYPSQISAPVGDIPFSESSVLQKVAAGCTSSKLQNPQPQWTALHLKGLRPSLLPTSRF